jgi:diphosphomevalonate decarboxylase
MTTAYAHPNIALIKYWGKQAKPGNLPATASLSITLSELTTTTSVCDAKTDTFWINGEVVDDAKITGFLRLLRDEFDFSPLQVNSVNNFPTSAGLASSASGFAALARAIDEHCNLGLDDQTLSGWARQGSASAARSIFGGFVTLEAPHWQANPQADAEYWDLRVVVAVTSLAAKQVSSTDGMERSRKTSDYFSAWLETADADFSEAMAALQTREFDRLANAAEKSCLKMHGVMLASHPALMYWNATTVSCMHAIRSLREQGTDVFFTNDAGPQIKAVCLPQSVDTVARTLRAIPGVAEVITCGLGNGATLMQETAPNSKPDPN